MNLDGLIPFLFDHTAIMIQLFPVWREVSSTPYTTET